MNRLTVIALIALALAAGFGAGQWRAETGPDETPSGESGTEREILYWVAPMDPNFRRDGPGKSPMGMDLVPVYADAATGAGDAVRIPAHVEQSLGVRTAIVEAGPLWRRITATGLVEFDETRISHIHVRSQGWIERLAVPAEGERVRAGDVLFELYSPDIVNAQKEYLQAKRRNDSSLIAAASEKLRAMGVARADIEALARRGMPEEKIQVRAPQAGVVIDLGVRDGMYVTPATVVMSIADLSTVWLMADVFEAQAAWLAEGQAAEARLGARPGVVFEGVVDHVYPLLDATSRTIRARIELDNAEEHLKPNMYADVVIYGGARRAVLSIPREALIRSGAGDRVVVALGDGRYAVQEVVAGIESGDWVEIRRGLRGGERIVTSAQFLIDSEASLSGSIRRLGAAEPDAEPPQTVFGSGRVERIEGRTLTIAHDPIDALGWPRMTMDFGVADEVPLNEVGVGSTVHFSLEPADDGFAIGMIHVLDDAGQGDD